MRGTTTTRGQTTARILAAGLFAAWGLAQWLYNQQFQQFAIFFSFSPTQLAWTLSLFNIAYFVLALPAALFHRRYGYKLGLLLSLSLFGVGAFLLYFAIVRNTPIYFLCAIATLGSGWAWFETCLNPLTVEAGKPSTAIIRLNAVQVFNAIGLVSGYLVASKLAAAHYYLSVGSVAKSTVTPYVVVGLASLLLAFFIEQLTLPDTAHVRSTKSGIVAELRHHLADRGVLFAALALAAYCLTLTVIWSATYQYRMQELGGREFDFFTDVFFWFFAGRAAATLAMRWIDPIRVLAIAAGLSLAAIAVAACLGGLTGWVCLIVISFLISTAYPTIFAATIVRHGAQTKLVSGLLVTAAGLGSAVGPLFVTPALAGWPIRAVLLLAAPVVAIQLSWAVFARRSAPSAASR
jgi:FHS family L-fucose permease-like MFS transporter